MDSIFKRTYWLTACWPVWKFGFGIFDQAFKDIVKFLRNTDGFKNAAK